MRAGDRTTVTATELAPTGHGIALVSGVRVHVPDLLPGETADIAVVHCSAHHPSAWAELEVRVGPPSPDRQRPACPAFGQCGGCVWQHLRYGAQLAEKRRRAEDALGRPVDAVVAAPSEHQFRNRGKYVFALDGRDTILGAYGPRSHRVVSTLGCQAVEATIDVAAQQLAREATRSGLSPYDERTRTGHLRYAVLRSNRAGQVLCALVTPSVVPQGPLQQLADALTTVSTVLHVRNDSTGGVLLSGPEETLVGSGTLREQAAGVPVDVGAAEFLQVNRDVADVLYETVADWLKKAGCTDVADLFSGVGGFAFAAAAAGMKVIAIERDPAAVSAAQRAATAERLAIDFQQADAATVFSTNNLDAIIVDPPRRGLSEDEISSLVGAAPAHLAYVSCDPTTFARDAGILASSGFVLVRSICLDMMPGTPQVEIAALFGRK